MTGARLRPLGLVVLLGACGGAQEAPPPPQVTVATPERRHVRYYQDFTGSVRAYEFAEVRARVSGTLDAMRFTPTAMVRQGQVLFVIEPGPYQAAFEEAEASVATAQSQLATATSDLDRVQRAAESDAVSRQDVDRAVAARDQAAAAVLAAEARLDRARINLGYTQVRSPLAGQVSRNFVDLGNLVGAGSPTLLTTVSRVQPIYVYFDAPERLVLRLLREQEAGARANAAEGEVGRVFVATAADSGFPHEGRIDFIDNTVDPATGTIELRAVLPNEDLQLFPGLFVRVRVVGGVRDDALVVSERALQTDLGGKYVLVVDDSSVVDRRYVSLGPVQDDGAVVVESGLEGSERYIVDGLLRARPGFPVQPEER